MLIDGEKWACDACVRGHRVSNCQHSDRPLQHINKKGRPVSQCQHCRGLRKARSAHVKCECGETAHTQANCLKVDRHDSSKTSLDASLCCCSHGGRCTCSLKKEQHLDPVLELDSGDSDSHESVFVKPRLIPTHSETALTVFANGHHKPVHKHNHMSQRCGVPYTIPRVHNVHGHHELARRSVDSLPATNSMESAHTPTMIKDSIVSAQQEVRLVRSEHGSPHPTAAGTFEDLDGILPPLDLNFYQDALSSRSQLDLHSVTSAPFDSNYCATPDTDPPIMSAGLDAPSVDWSHFDLPLNNYNNNNNNNSNAFSAYNQPPSFASFDYRNLGQPEMSNASSAEPSEHGDLIPFSPPSPVQAPSLVHNRFPSDSSDVGECESYRISGTSSFQGLPQMSMLASSGLESLDIDEYLNATTSSASAYLPITSITSISSTAAMTETAKVEQVHRHGHSVSIDRFSHRSGSPSHHSIGPTSVPAATSPEDRFVGVSLTSYPFEKTTPIRSSHTPSFPSIVPTSVPREDVDYGSLSVTEESSTEQFWMPSSFDLASLDQLNDLAASDDVWNN